MLDNITQTSGLTRRSFLKTTAGAAVALSALGTVTAFAEEEQGASGAAANDYGQKVYAEGEQKFFQSCMGNCAGMGCPCWVTVRDGKVCNIEHTHLEMPDGSASEYQVGCLKMYANIERMYSPKRALYPMKRTGERGSGEFERISWDQAIQEITDKWKQLLADYGPQSIAFFSGSGNYFTSVGYPARLRQIMGSTSIGASYDWTGMFTQIAHGSTAHNEWRDIPNAENLFIWCTNPSESIPQMFHKLTEAKANGTKVICIDPVYTTAASKADKFVSIKPATDGLLAAGMLKISIRDGFVDKECLQTKTVGCFLVKDDGMYLRLSDLGKAEAGTPEDSVCVWDNGEPVAIAAAADPEIEGYFEVDGIKVRPAYQVLLERLDEWDLETISEFTEIPLEIIEELTAIWNSGRSMIWTGFGADHYSNGQTFYDGALALCDVTGQIGKHGCGMTCTDFSGASGYGLTATTTVGVESFPAGPTIYPAHLPQLMENGSIPEAGFEVAPKSLFVFQGNPITNEPDRLAWIDAFNKMDMVVISDVVMCETALYADYVLPVPFLFEKTDLVSTFSPYVKICDQAAEPMGESKNDFDITCMLGEAMGYGEYFTQSYEDFLASCVDNDTAKAFGITWDRLNKEKAVFAFLEEPAVCMLNTPPYTASGRLEFYHEGIQPQNYAGYTDWDMLKESCWFWEPPLESWPETKGKFEANPLAEKYPFILISERCKFKTHTQWNESNMILEIDPEPYIKMNPDDAAALGIAEGDIIRVWNDRSYVVIKAVINAGVRPGLMVIDHGWERDSYIEGHYSDLSGHDTWQRYEQDNWFDCLVAVEKVM
ncbi:MAG: molybdopterin-dependent oxidoreductase [Coriobacteriales bacterium]|nr:molybdopterin-dependent oxidoreductase [Coriobacteriales bacterium]